MATHGWGSSFLARHLEASFLRHSESRLGNYSPNLNQNSESKFNLNQNNESKLFDLVCSLKKGLFLNMSSSSPSSLIEGASTLSECPFDPFGDINQPIIHNKSLFVSSSSHQRCERRERYFYYCIGPTTTIPDMEELHYCN